MEIKTFPEQKRTIIYNNKPHFIYLPKTIFINYHNRIFIFYEYQNYWHSYCNILPNIKDNNVLCIYNKIDINNFWNLEFNDAAGTPRYFKYMKQPHWWEKEFLRNTLHLKLLAVFLMSNYNTIYIILMINLPPNQLEILIQRIMDYDYSEGREFILHILNKRIENEN